MLANAIVLINIIDGFHVFIGILLEKFHHSNGHFAKRFQQIGRQFRFTMYFAGPPKIMEFHPNDVTIRILYVSLITHFDVSTLCSAFDIPCFIFILFSFSRFLVVECASVKYCSLLRPILTFVVVAIPGQEK